LTDKPRGYSLLHLVAGLAQLKSVTFLLDCGADPNGELLRGAFATCCACADVGGAAAALAALQLSQNRHLLLYVGWLASPSSP